MAGGNGGSWFAYRVAQDKDFTMKLIVRCLLLLFIIASIIAAVARGAYFMVGYYAFIAPAWVLSFIWSCIWVFVHMSRNQGPVAPGLVVAFDLLFWLYYPVGLTFGWILYDSWGNRGYYYGGSYRYNSEEGDFDAQLRSIIASTVFVGLIIIAHFWLFVMGCIDESRRRARAYANNNGCCAHCSAPIPMICNNCIMRAPGMPSGYQTYPAGQGQLVYAQQQQQVPVAGANGAGWPMAQQQKGESTTVLPRQSIDSTQLAKEALSVTHPQDAK